MYINVGKKHISVIKNNVSNDKNLIIIITMLIVIALFSGFLYLILLLFRFYFFIAETNANQCMYLFIY